MLTKSIVVMASKTFYSFAFLCLSILPFLSHASWADQNVHKPSPFRFIKNLQGSKKGDKVENLYKLKKYLHHFGYLNDTQLNNPEILDKNHFDDTIEIAIKTYQLNFNLKPTGSLDPETVSTMMMPRCGVPDIVNGRTRMNSGGKYSVNYAFYYGAPKWPLSSKVLNWGLLAGTRRDIIDPVSNYALLSWTGVTPFTFKFVDENVSNADIRIGFVNRSSALSEGALGFAFKPTIGTVYFNGNLNWSDGTAAQGTYDMGTVALHELGHALGLEHSSVEGAIMWPTLGSGVIKGLHDDDYQGMKALYAS